MVPHIKKFETEDDVAVALANYIYHLSAKFIARHSLFSVMLSGGTLIDTMRLTGEVAADAVKVALGKHANDDGYPFHVQKFSHEGTLTWFLDKEATSELC
ncbi:probable 6-phosphogluconolactonase 4, chloroplastic [Tanacetum coccineum]|uniref:Probable 6-phosphogluconolactonase 4, chloroplastic n=1 Tax=Tanacetum coccineum TaxID=301880 RepID=A0ABQ4YB82_9ASTR